ncbi:MAG: hypothetical protein Q7R22_011355 [Verrucomicrobiota bacterium JB025]|nr:hypothetical protein [Verrucomicrobiota bacterium JB025]
MTAAKSTIPILLAALTPLAPAAPPDLDQAEVRIPYAELVRLIDSATSRPPEAPEPPPLPAVLLAARYRIDFSSRTPALHAAYRIEQLATGWHSLPLVHGPLSLGHADPEDTRIVVHDRNFCIALDQPGTHSFRADFLPLRTPAETITFHPGPASSTDIHLTGIPENHAVSIGIDGQSTTLTTASTLPLPATGGAVTIRLIAPQEAAETLSPPLPSEWSWQHHALVKPSDTELSYHLLTHASATAGSGLAATLTLPPEARSVTASGDDLANHHIRRLPDGSRILELAWETRGILDRDLEISYATPLRPLDKQWTLATPAATRPDATRARFSIAGRDQLSYAADDLSGPFSPASLPATLASRLAGNPWFLLEAGASATLAIQRLPLAATADATVDTVLWSQLIEPDGASLTSGSISISHRSPMRIPLRLPDSASLLDCSVAGTPVRPLRREDGTLEIPLPAPPNPGKLTRIDLSYTNRLEPLDPVEGTLSLQLPVTPLFIHSLAWAILLPDSYTAETHGNLTRLATADSSPPSTIRLSKKLIRNEQPATALFYLHPTVLP